MVDILCLLGSASDKPVSDKLAKVLDEFDVTYRITVASAHRTPERVEQLLAETDAKVLVGMAGLSAALPGVMAAQSSKPVIGVPVSGKTPFDSLLSTVQMPPGVPVASVGVDRGDNAGLLAVRILALSDEALAKQLEAYKQKQAAKVASDADELERSYE